MAILSTVTSETPVDTGRARSNWIVGLGAARRDTVESYGPEDATAVATSAGSAVIAGYVNRGQAIYISNNLPYIERLNDGWSAQAPAQFVQSAIQQAVSVISRSRLVAAQVDG